MLREIISPSFFTNPTLKGGEEVVRLKGIVRKEEEEGEGRSISPLWHPQPRKGREDRTTRDPYSEKKRGKGEDE